MTTAFVSKKTWSSSLEVSVALVANSLKVTDRHSTCRCFRHPKRKLYNQSSNHPFSDAKNISFREGRLRFSFGFFGMLSKPLATSSKNWSPFMTVEISPQFTPFHGFPEVGMPPSFQKSSQVVLDDEEEPPKKIRLANTT